MADFWLCAVLDNHTFTMSEIANSEGTSAADEKPVILSRLLNDVKFPPFPDPTEEEFEEDIGDDERTYYRTKFADLDIIKSMRLHCSACDRHLGSSTKNESRMRAHPMLRTLVCHTCHTFYNSGEFEKGDDGSELYCRWCGQGGQVYCCSDCPHVFCAKCIKRNLGVQKIKEIENTDDWKCFKCNSKCLWDLRAICWALLRYCDMKNKITYKTEDSVLKEAYQKDCAVDYTECCKNKGKRKDRTEPAKKKEEKKTAASAIARIPSAIQVKKFASINLEDTSPKEKKPQKRSLNSNDPKMILIKNPISISPLLNPVAIPPAKKPRMQLMNPVRFAQQEKKNLQTYARIRPKLPTMPIPIMTQQYNGFGINNNTFHNFGNMVPNDTLNLSLDSLTQGLDMVAVAAMNNSTQDDDVVCTPDFPLEPLCEVTEDNTDDDVQCITPGPVVPPKIQAPQHPPRIDSSLPDLTPENIVQMTDNDVTVNSVTGGLKFRVDPQTLSSNKMYRLPDGRIFAIKANPNMPGGYSATIVAVTETGQAKSTPKGATYAAKLSAVTSSQTTPPPLVRSRATNQGPKTKPNILKTTKVTRGTDTSARECDLQVPVEWYRYNLVDAVDALEYSLHRLYKLKKEATCRFLRTRTVEEMKSLHKTLDRLLNTSATRFNEIKDNLNKEIKSYIAKKTGGTISDDDDDDVEILPDLEDDDPIYIDENSVESNSNDVTCNESQEVDLTGVGSSDHNDSTEILGDGVSKTGKDSHNGDEINTEKTNISSENIISDADILQGEENQKEVKRPDSKDASEKSEEQVDNTEKSKDGGNKVKDIENDNKKTDKEKDNKDGETDNNDKDNEMDVDKDSEINNDKDDGTDKDDEDENKESNVADSDNTDSKKTETRINEENELNGDSEQGKKSDNELGKELKKEEEKKEDLLKDDEKKLLSDDNSTQDNDGKIEDSEMSEEMIENLLFDDNTDNNILKNNSMEVVESL